ncbi:hypothetical protein OHS33_02410 [Streptomyces sp. NBC_00536]|uniref:hypothetical protein n=1 Tax=Streptomyces sp. NBC_00536 TaxID=2975769 RepID=UPI002E819F53|nr:hypothetical protein [Streptomyces sp. NBC_00536]WUC77304.1 hypothetical protein OHS33_02410 [Streptomyces sp. NBC_00536]
MFTSSWQRPLILAAASLAFVTGTACAAQASQSQAPAGVASSALAGQPTHCVANGGEGGEGGEGGAGGQGGQPGQPGEPGKPGGVGCFTFKDLPDKPKEELTVVDRVRIVMTLLADDSKDNKEKIAKKYKITTEQLDTWKKNYLDGDWFALTAGSLSGVI